MKNHARSYAFQEEVETHRKGDVFISSGSNGIRRATVNHHPSAWMRLLSDRFNEISSLPTGWDGYGGVAVKFNTAQFAAQVIERLYMPDLVAPSIVPGSDGSMQAEWHLNGFDVELDFLGPLKVVAYRFDHVSQDEEEVELESDFTLVAGWIADLAADRAFHAEQTA
tara:strand:- start:48 stop:548 length:501 start_codon:yes stop_codon:yes gene_type:complete